MAKGGPQPVPQQQPQPAVLIQGQEPLTASTLAAASSQEQNQMFGESLFPLIPNMHSEKITRLTFKEEASRAVFITGPGAGAQLWKV